MVVLTSVTPLGIKHTFYSKCTTTGVEV